MPFTFSHVAAVLPLRSSRLNFLALAIGAMSPDFSYILALIVNIGNVHNVPGVVLFCMPVSMIAWFVYVKFLHEHWQKSFPILHELDIDAGFFKLAASTCLGALTHVAWDGFTHWNGFFVGVFPVLTMDVMELWGRPLKLYNALQHGSTLVGGMALILALRGSLASNREKRLIHSFGSILRPMFAVIILTILFSGKLLARDLDTIDSGNVKMFVARIAFRFLAALFLVVLLAPLASKLSFRPTQVE